MSYRKKHIKNKIHKIKPQKSVFKRPVFWIVFLSAVVVVALVYFSLFYPNLQVKNIVISGNERVAEQDLHNFTTGLVNRKIIGFGLFELNSKSIFFIDCGSLKQNILKEFPAIEDVKIDRDLPQTLKLGVQERKQFGVFCSQSEKCFLIDQNGVIFELVLAIPGGAPIVRQMISEGEVFTGEEVVNKNIMNLISKIEKNLREKFGIDMKEAFVTSPIRLDITTSENWQIYFNIESISDADIEIAKLELLLSGEITPEIRKNLHYVDLRFKDRAYYR